ncbi:hypothetical protein F7Q99_39030 [Streptomyces kaniharaensis]|uniref:PPM-type phosphatase domain-containing protein n=1 Tax=Streptomyces kaniharaensis TaxID=212423 RepID=A0A6N7L511_9ACTN|nr:hypothetical protein [Streptomyces kaniharaensis]MQS18027.1 hypothetical protein [Streptomyces kaniharaensis]
MTTVTQPSTVLSAVATAVGSTGVTGDGAYVHTLRDGSVGACLVDGIGHSEQITARAALLAEVGARLAGTKGPLHGLLTAAELIADPGPDDNPEEDAVAVAAVAHPDRAGIALAWTGDCAAWSYDPATDTVERLTTDHTMGEFLRTVHPGGPPARARHHDDWVRVSLARSSIATVRETETTAPLVVLASDGITKTLGERRLATLLSSHGSTNGSPQRIADSLLQAAMLCAADLGGERDDATVIVLNLSSPAAECAPPETAS